VDDRVDDTVKPYEDVRADIEKSLRDKEMQKQTASYLKKAWSETSVWVAPSYQARLSPAPEVP